MNQVKIGKFIAKERKNKNYTQRKLASLLGISDKTISKWECGNGFPEASLLLPLCKELEITVNELLTGERLTEVDYKKKAEENMMNLIEERQENKRKVVLSAATVLVTLLGSLTILLVAKYLPMKLWLQTLLIVIGLIVLLGGIGIAATLEWQAGTYECRYCKTRFVPTAGAYIVGVHTLTTRRLRCPKCGKKSWCKRRLTH